MLFPTRPFPVARVKQLSVTVYSALIVLIVHFAQLAMQELSANIVILATMELIVQFARMDIILYLLFA